MGDWLEVAVGGPCVPRFSSTQSHLVAPDRASRFDVEVREERGTRLPRWTKKRALQLVLEGDGIGKKTILAVVGGPSKTIGTLFVVGSWGAAQGRRAGPQGLNRPIGKKPWRSKPGVGMLVGRRKRKKEGEEKWGRKWERAGGSRQIGEPVGSNKRALRSHRRSRKKEKEIGRRDRQGRPPQHSEMEAGSFFLGTCLRRGRAGSHWGRRWSARGNLFAAALNKNGFSGTQATGRVGPGKAGIRGAGQRRQPRA